MVAPFLELRSEEDSSDTVVNQVYSAMPIYLGLLIFFIRFCCNLLENTSASQNMKGFGDVTY